MSILDETARQSEDDRLIEVGRALLTLRNSHGDDALRHTLATLDDRHLADAERGLAMAQREAQIGAKAAAEWRATPATMANHLSGGRMQLYPYVRLLGDKYVDACEGRSLRQIWNLPSQYGKSSLASQWGPVWALDHNPHWRLILASYGDELADANALAVRDILTQHSEDLHTSVRRDARRQDRFLTPEGGGVLSAGINSSATGFPAHGVIIDDPFKNWQEAHSPARRKLVYDQYRSVFRMRQTWEGFWIIVVMCMTGDTPVLMADGTQRPLVDIRPGDQIASYDDGRLTATRVLNWGDQGADRVYEVRMRSGRKVRANARHPFRVIQENGVAEWVRLESLRAGMKVRSVEAPIQVSSAPLRNVTTPRSAKACACLTTTALAGPQDTDRPQLTTRHDVPFDSKGATGSPSRNTTDSSLSRAGVAPSVASEPTRSTDPSTGLRSYASTTITTAERCEGCSATTAISSSVARTQYAFFKQPSRTWRIATDEIVEIVECGIERVFDIEVECTHNFIANGLEVSNTRWHEDDLSARLVADMLNGGEQWEVIRIAEVAEEPDPKSLDYFSRLPDPLGRAPGEILEPRRFGNEAVAGRRKAAGPYLWAGMHQQRPSPEEGGEFKRGWWVLEAALPPAFDQLIASWDMKLKEKKSGDYQSGQVWGRTGGSYWLVDHLHGQWNMATISNAIALLHVRYPNITAHLIENTGNGPEVIEELRRARPDYVLTEEVANDLGMTVDERAKVQELRRHGMSALIPQNPKGDKIARARAHAGSLEAGDMHLLDTPGARALIDQAAGFPDSTQHDDMVDSWSQAMNYLRGGPAAIETPEGERRVETQPASERQGGQSGGVAVIDPRQRLLPRGARLSDIRRD